MRQGQRVVGVGGPSNRCGSATAAWEACPASFKRLGESRAAKVATEMSRLRTLADKSRFRYTDQQVEELEQFLLDQLKETIAAFREGTGSKKQFRFGGYGS